MTKLIKVVSPDAKVKGRIIVALDVETRHQALAIARELAGSVGAFKVGLQLFTLAGPDIVREIADLGSRVFLDLKFHDIPNTVAGASIEAARLGVWMFNMHTLGGGEMMRRSVEAVGEVCERDNLNRPLVIGVTMLTSADEKTLAEVGIDRDVEQQVVKLALLAEDCGLDGVVASPREARAVKTSVTNPLFLTVTPGIRSDFATGDDQKRVTTIREAFANGSDYVVIGRPITGATDKLAALEQIAAEAA